MVLENPIPYILQARQQKDQNWLNAMNQLAQAIGTSSKGFAEGYQVNKQKQSWQKAINEYMNNPNVPQNAKSLGPLLAQRPDLAANVISYLSRSQKLETLGGGKRVVYQMPDGSVSLQPQEGAVPMEVSDAQAMQYTAVPKSSKERSKAMSDRAEAWQRSIDVKQIDELARTTGLQPHQRNILQQNNMRADRALELASRPMTWQEFNMVLTDAAAIMQGGVPHIDQLHNAAYPTWQQEFARYKTFVTSSPTTNVPQDIVDRVSGMIKGIKQVDNRYLKMNSQFQQKMLGPTIRGGIKSFAPTINSMTTQMTEGGAPSGTSDFSSMSDDELKRIASGGR